MADPIATAIQLWHDLAVQTTLDKFGRIVIPKPVRDALRLDPGDALELTLAGEVLTVAPVRQPQLFSTRSGLPVYLGPLPTGDQEPGSSE
jgi:AbrB family looped-hinge helix DNA binding protein